jgi:hypothetical protein
MDPLFLGELSDIISKGNVIKGRCDGFVPQEGDFVVLPVE